MFKYPKPAKIVDQNLCEPIAKYCASAAQYNLFNNAVQTKSTDIRVIELFAGVGGFRIGLEHASQRYKTVWNSQWEPSTKTQDASAIYQKRFGVEDIPMLTLRLFPLKILGRATCLSVVSPVKIIPLHRL